MDSEGIEFSSKITQNNFPPFYKTANVSASKGTGFARSPSSPLLSLFARRAFERAGLIECLGRW